MTHETETEKRGSMSQARFKMWAGASGALVAVAIAALGLAGCVKENNDFCVSNADCESGQDCIDKTCDDSLEPDASLECPAQSHQCLPAAPADWNGPTIRAEIAIDEALPDCAAPAMGGLANGAGFEPGGSCDCSCTTAATLSCTNGRVENTDSGAAGCFPGTPCQGQCPGQELTPNVCTSMSATIDDQTRMRFIAGTINSGTCEAPTLTETLPEAVFEEHVALCAVETTVGGCGDEGVCAPSNPPGFADESCIFREGVHDCPADSAFTEQTISFASLTDNRSCGSCACDLPANGLCSGIIQGSPNTACSIAGEGQATSSCELSSAWSNENAFTYSPVPNMVNCAPAESNPAVIGEVAGVDAVTVCCTPNL